MSTLIAQKRESTADRREAIAAAARALLVEKGFEGLRTRDIAERVGINVATLHYHVPTKDALIDIVADSACAEFAAQGRANPKDGKTPLQRLRLEFEDFFDTVENRPELLAVVSEFSQRARRDAKVRVALDRLHSKWLGFVVNILAQGVRDGTFRADLDPAVGGAMIIAALTGAVRLSGGGSGLIRSIAAELERSVLNPNQHSPSQD